MNGIFVLVSCTPNSTSKFVIWVKRVFLQFMNDDTLEESLNFVGSKH